MKKQIRILMVIALMICTAGAFAQKPFAGNITFEMTAEGSSDPNVAAQLAEQLMTQPFLAEVRTSVMGVSDVVVQPLITNMAATAITPNTFFISLIFWG